MSIVMHKFTCGVCSTTFFAPSISGGYGELMMRSAQDRAPAFLDALDDPVYDEVDHLLDAIGAYDGKTPQQRGEILQNIFGAACDLGSDGSELRIGLMPKCPTCSSDQMASWSIAKPLQSYDGPLDSVTHSAWQLLSRDEKIRLLRSRLS